MASKEQPAKRKRKTDGQCILCGLPCDEDRSNTTPDAWKNLKGLALQWQGLDKFGTVYETVSWDEGPRNVFFHRGCKLTLSSKQHVLYAAKRQDKAAAAAEILEEEQGCRGASPTPTESTRRLSRTSGLIHDKNLCVWCMKPKDEKHPKRDRWHLLQTRDAWYAFKAHTVYLEDPDMRDRIIALTDAIHDPFAAEIRYHRSCWRKYLLAVEQNDEDKLHIQDVRPSEIKQMFFQHVRSAVFEQHELRTLQSLLADYNALQRNFGFHHVSTRSSYIKDILQKEFGDEIGFHDRFRKNESILVYDTRGGGSYIEAALYSLGVSDDQVVRNAASRIKSHVADGSDMEWPPSVDDLENDQSVNELLVKFLVWLKTPTKQSTDASINDPRVHALASLLKSYVTGKPSSFQTQLSVTLHGLTRSREIIDILRKFSLGISYKKILHLYDAWAKHDLEKNPVCPEELAENTPGTGILDNDDFKDDTLTGGDTSHRTNVMFVQPENLEVVRSETEAEVEPLPSGSTDLKSMCMAQHQIKPYKTVKRGQPVPRPEIDITTQDTTLQKQRSVIHALVRVKGDLSDVPPAEQKTAAFGGFQSTVQQDVSRSKPYFFLTFPRPPHKSVVHEVMCRMVAAAEKKHMPFILLVGDQPVYTLMAQLKAENPGKMKLVLPFLGPFHIHGSFMSAIYKRFDGSGLADLLVAAEVIAEGSVDHALRGKHYKRSIRCLRLMHETLVRRILRRGIQHGVSLPEDLETKIDVLCDPSKTPEEKQDMYLQLESDPGMASFVAKVFQIIEASQSTMARFWLSFMHMVEILLMNLHALRTRNWEEFKATLRMSD